MTKQQTIINNKNIIIMTRLQERKLFELFEFMTTPRQKIVVDLNKKFDDKRVTSEIFYGAEDFSLKLINEEENTETIVSLSEIVDNGDYFIITISPNGTLKRFTPIFSDRNEIPNWLRLINDFFGMKVLDSVKKNNLKFWKIRMDELVYLINHPKRK